MPGIDIRVRLVAPITPPHSPRSMMATPSPTYSTTSLWSEGAPITPPTHARALPTTDSVVLNPALAYRPGALLPIAYDLSTLPQTASLGAMGHMRTVLAEPATHPPMARITLVTDELPYAITVSAGAVVDASSPAWAYLRPLPSVNGPAVAGPYAHEPFVTVENVLNALYLQLRPAISPAEFAAMSPSHAARVTAACQARIARVADPRAREAERRKGVKRIDRLLAAGKSRLAGLQATKKGPDVFVLRLGG